MQKALADDFPSDLPRLIDGVAPNEKKMKNVFGFYLFIFLPPHPDHWEEGDKLICRQPRYHLFVCHTSAHSFHTHTHTNLSSLDQTHTPTYVAAVLTDGVRGGPHLPKCRCWTDCGGVMNGWSRLGRGAEETISAMLISPLLLRPPSIPHPPVLPPILSSVVPVNHCLSLSPHPISWTSSLSASLSLFLSPYLNEFAPYGH